MRRVTRAQAYLRAAMLIVALALPLLSLILLGSYWLWENGYVVYWAAAAFLVTLTAYGVERWLLRDAVAGARKMTDAAEVTERGWTAREHAAWDAVKRIAADIKPATLDSRDAILALATRTVDAVAKRMHPGEKDPLWTFTLPEALALIERVSGELGPFVRENIPLGDRLTVAQAVAIYRWRNILGVAETAFDLWRIIRLMNPASAITQEMRETITRQLYDWGREELARRLAVAYVREVGRAAIDLYSGRLRVSPEALAETVTPATRQDRAEAQALAEPLRILIVGQVGAGKSSLVNALLEEVRAAVDVLPATRGYTAYELKREDTPEALLIDSPGLTAEAAAALALLDEADVSDLIVWVTSATRPDRQIDRKALDAIRSHMAARLERRQPPILVVLTHIDQLRPVQEWSPPYDLEKGEAAKSLSIRAASEVVAAELDAPIQTLVPVCLDASRGTYNVDVVWAKILDVMPEAHGARLLRVLVAARNEESWRRVWAQAVNAGRVITRALIS
jgi:predicted GTPase